VKRRYAKMTAHRETCYRVFWTSVWLISYSGELCNNNCIVKNSETFEARSVTLCQDATKGKLDRRYKW